MRSLLLSSLIVATAALTVAGAPPPPCANCLNARVWPVDPEDFRKTGDPQFPETARLAEMTNRVDLGIAFSGGGTRSASATLGQLRGLRHLGWLDRVRYIAAVSGGSWAALPYTYWKGRDDDLLGVYEEPAQLDHDKVLLTPNGTLAKIISESSIAGPGLREAAGEFRTFALPENANAYIDKALSALDKSRREAGRANKTYSRLLQDKFITPLVGSQSGLRVGWEERSVDQISTDNPRTLGAHEFIKVPDGRPFFIAGATLVPPHPAFYYPPLAPVEYTPLYSGIRQQFGAIGGAYIATWAYDSVDVSPGEGGLVRVRPAADGRTFTPADIISSTGAAPQLTLLLGARGKGMLNKIFGTASGYFPAYHPIAVRATGPALGAEIPHGDGGFMDYFGIMPLLARHVRNIIVFINSNNDFDQNDDLHSLFFEGARNDSGDKSMNIVFTPARYHELMTNLAQRRTSGAPPVYCGTNWEVAANEAYNIRTYGDLNICWVYNRPIGQWNDTLKAPIKQIMSGDTKTQTDLEKKAGSFADFPWYKTFEQKPPYVIELSVAQVNLLSNLTAWTVANKDSAAALMNALGRAFGGRPPAVPAGGTPD